MDVEKVYFSVRLSTERKRISQQVKPEEDILVMFSGAAPYPCVLSKNTEARQIYGIEINPLGHRYGENNIRLNKLNNIFLLNGDVKNIVPKFYQNILGLKCAVIPSQLDNMIKREPKILEFHTFISDFEDNFKILQRSIEKVQKRGIKLWVHQPIDINNPIDVAREDASHPIYRKMLSLVDKYGVNLVLHPSHQAPSDTSTEKIIRNIKTFRKYYDNVFFENGMYSCFFSKDQILKVIDSSGLKSFCIDISHFLYNYKKAELLSVIKDIQRRCTTYFHLNDYKKTDSAVLDKNSNVDMDKILPLVTKGVVEVRSDDEDDPKEQLASFDYLSNFQRTFDRILMPLPKSAEDFLDSALKASKKGTIIHFYDFLHEDNFHEAHEKISAACKSNKKRFKILDTVRCGQHSPRTYRICVDFKIL